MSGKNVFIVGPGFIGWVLITLLVEEGYNVTGLVRRKEHGQGIEKSGAKAVYGDLADHDLIAKHASEHDITIHTATADDMPSVLAVLDGVRKRAAAGQPTIYIHTSGTSVIGDGAAGQFQGDKIYRDDDRSMIDEIPEDAPHRAIDLKIVQAQRELGDKAKMVIIMPPAIYGYNDWNERLTIQIPTLTRWAIKHGYASHVGKGISLWSQVHVNDLARGYMTLLHFLEKSSPKAAIENPYFFCENGKEFSWKEAAENIGQGLAKAGVIKSAEPKTMPEEGYKDIFGTYTDAVVGVNSRSRAVRLRELGWEPKEKDVFASFHEDELPAILREDNSNFAGYGGAVASGK